MSDDETTKLRFVRKVSCESFEYLLVSVAHQESLHLDTFQNDLAKIVEKVYLTIILDQSICSHT